MEQDVRQANQILGVTEVELVAMLQRAKSVAESQGRVELAESLRWWIGQLEGEAPEHRGSPSEMWFG